jgi:hypothetical protein
MLKLGAVIVNVPVLTVTVPLA